MIPLPRNNKELAYYAGGVIVIILVVWLILRSIKGGISSIFEIEDETERAVPKVAFS